MNKILLIILIIFLASTIFVPETFAEEISADPPEVVSEAAIVIEANTGKVLFRKNENDKMYPASLTKIATAIYAIEKGQLNDVLTVSNNARTVAGTTVYLEEGEKVPLKKLIQGLLINSGNDAGVAIAEYLSGSVEQFSKDINTYLIEVVGVHNTNFENSHGLFNSEHITTANDLAKIVQYAMKNETFREVFGTKELEWEGESWDTTLLTHHKMVKGEIAYDGITGGKNGYVNQSGFTLATTAEKNNLSVIVIALDNRNEDEIYNDTKNLLDYAFANYKTSSIQEGATFKLNEEEYVTDKTLYYTTNINDRINKSVVEDGILTLSNQKDEIISSYQLEKIGEIEVGKVNEYSTTNINDGLNNRDNFNYFSIWTIAIFLSVLSVTYLYTTIFRITNKN